MKTLKLKQVGGSVMVTIPPHILRELKLAAGSQVDVTASEGRVTIAPAKTRRIGLKARLAMCDFTARVPSERVKEDQAWDRAPPAGREVL